jgi:2-(1,2-epoxy-1,2-dihydrophenyl)acetyl-CoA isomerase
LKANEIVHIGLINKAVPANELDAAVKGYTDFYAKAPTKSIGLIKKMLNKAQTAMRPTARR